MSPVIEVEALEKRYGETIAVDGLSFAVEAGEIFGMVGPNGAGKTTTIECVEGMRRPDGGRLQVLGHNPSKGGDDLRERIGVQLQESALSPRIKAWEALDLFTAFYRRQADWRDLARQLDLEEKLDSRFEQLSGGQKQRLAIALALVNDPELVFLDELTTGLDPHARRSMWDLVRGIRDRGKTVLLTTHFMEEAERLCDRVAIVERGKIVALDTPEALVESLGGTARVILQVTGEAPAEALLGVQGVTAASRDDDRIEVEGTGSGLAGRVVQALADRGVEIRDVTTQRATLEDVFLARTGCRPAPAGTEEVAS